MCVYTQTHVYPPTHPPTHPFNSLLSSIIVVVITASETYVTDQAFDVFVIQTSGLLPRLPITRTSHSTRERLLSPLFRIKTAVPPIVHRHLKFLVSPGWRAFGTVVHIFPVLAPLPSTSMVKSCRPSPVSTESTTSNRLSTTKQPVQ